MSQTKVTDALRNVTAVDGTKINAVDGAKITTGTIPEARITSLDATKLTGNIANARIPASAVTQHVTGYNDASIRADILKLAIHQAIDGNRVAYNLEDSFIDGFEDDTGITTETTVDRDTTSEYVASIYTTDVVTTPSTGDWTGDTGSFTITSGGADCTNGDDAIKSNWTSGTGDFTIQLTVTAYSNQTFGVYPVSEDGSFTTDSYGGMSGMTNSWWWTGNSTAQAANAQYRGYNQNTSVFSDGDIIEDGSVVQIKRVSGTISILIDGTSRHTYSQTSSADLRFVVAHHGTTSGNVQSMTFTASSSSTNSTGTLISDPQTASTSRTSCSGVIIYSDAAGTNTLGTHLKIYFSCDNSTWTEAASYGTATTYSGTKKLVKLGATTCTAGTSIAMKAEWANQVASVAGGYETGNRTSTITITDDTPGQAGGLINDADGATSNLVDGVTDTNGSTHACTFHGTAASGRYLRFQFSTAKTVTEAKWYQDASATHGVWKWQGSNDGTSFTDIGTSFTLGGTLQTQTELNGNTTAYTYYQLLGISGSASGSAWIREVEFKTAAVAGKEARLHGWAVNY